MKRWLEIALLVAGLAVGITGWWLYLGEVKDTAKPPVPAPRAGSELAQTQQALPKERDNTEQSRRELAMARREQGSPVASPITGDAELRQALQQSEWLSATYQDLLAQERIRNRELEQELERRQDDQKLMASEGSRNEALEQELEQAHHDPESLERERDRNREVDEQFSALRNAGPEGHRNVTADLPSAAQLGRPQASALPAAPLEEPANPEQRRLMARASLLLRQGNVAAARVVLDHAAGKGSAEALFALAETYDPIMLSRWGTLGTQGDIAKAQELYAKAWVGGIQEAKARLSALH